jgi:hypothetical protein
MMKKFFVMASACLLLSACGGSSSSSGSDSAPPIADADKDGIADHLDAFPSDATESVDTDGDGVGDNADAFPLNPQESLDADRDGLADRFDAFPNDATETVDTDGDGIGNNADNCFLWPNADQYDSNNDGIGNACANNDSGVSYSVRNTDPEDASAWELDVNCSDNGNHTSDDCARGRDSQQKVMSKIGSGVGAFDFTKISLAGAELPFTATEQEGWACTRDNVTGLTWELKSNQVVDVPEDASKHRRFLHSREHVYISYDPELPIGHWNSNKIPDKSFPDFNNCDVKDTSNSIAQCRTDLYLGKIKTEYQAEGGLCGINSWRLPTIYELDSIVSHELPDTEAYADVRLLVDADFFNVGINHPFGAGGEAETITFTYCSSTRKLTTFNPGLPVDLTNSPENYPVMCRSLINVPTGFRTHTGISSGGVPYQGTGMHIMLVAETPREP